MGECPQRLSVRIEVAFDDLDASEIDGLEEGDILLIETEHLIGRINGQSCKFFLDGQHFGRGETIDVEGKPGVRITRVSRKKGAQPSP